MFIGTSRLDTNLTSGRSATERLLGPRLAATPEERSDFRSPDWLCTHILPFGEVSRYISAMIASSFASFSPSRPALYLGNTFWKSDYPQVSCVARSNCKPTIDPVVSRRAACLTAEPNR